ncbi:MAG TPA: hypothetical protein VH678_00945 [Xanthobacteraceae bacterium]
MTKEWLLVTGAPVIAIGGAIAIIFVTVLIVRWAYSLHISTLNARISRQNEDIQRYKEDLQRYKDENDKLRRLAKRMKNKKRRAANELKKLKVNVEIPADAETPMPVRPGPIPAED